MNTLYTVGHSTHSIDYFLELLQSQEISCIVDVRSVAASAYNPQFNKEFLSNFLKKHKITYLHFAQEFGARHTDFAVLDSEGQVDFDKIRQTKIFLSGVDRIQKGIEKGFKIAMMCSEADPIECHRFSMISVYLSRNDFEVKHILKDKSVVSNEDLEEEILKKYAKKIRQSNLFETVSKEIQLLDAYRVINKEIGFSPNDTTTHDHA
jgi:uncharacterized protein (DUF488 family)